MDADRCPACGRTFTPGEVTGLGILRSRPAAAGGPFLEFACPGCDRRLHLIPHGDGRYAPPGQPPPPPAPPEQRRPPWVDAPGARSGRPPGRTAEEPPPPPPPEPPPRAGGQRREPAPPPGGSETPEARARALLGVAPDADAEAVARAFRERSRTCHPDKVAHLDAEFQALAERKFKALKAAHDLLRDFGSR